MAYPQDTAYPQGPPPPYPHGVAYRQSSPPPYPPGTGHLPGPGYPQQTGWGPPPWPPPPPPPRRRTGRVVALVLAGTIVLAGLGVGTFLAVRGATGAPGSIAGAEPPVSFRDVRTPFLSYAVPSDWDVAGNVEDPTALGLAFTGTAAGAAYDCAGESYLRGVVSSTLVPDASPPAEIAGVFARELGRSYYSGDAGEPEVTVRTPRVVDVGGVTGSVVEATVRTATDDGCLATEGTVLVLAVPAAGPDGAPSTALLMVNGDVSGGPAEPASPDRTTLDAIVGSARLASI